MGGGHEGRNGVLQSLTEHFIERKVRTNDLLIDPLVLAQRLNLSPKRVKILK